MADIRSTGATDESARTLANDLKKAREDLIEAWAGRSLEGANAERNVLPARTRPVAGTLLDAIIGDLAGETDDSAEVEEAVQQSVKAGANPTELERCLTILRRTIEDHLKPSDNPADRLGDVVLLHDKVDSLRETVAQATETALFERMRENGEKHRNLMRYTDEAIFLCDRDDLRIREASNGAEQLVGYNLDELLTMSLPEIVTPEEAEWVLSPLRELAPGSSPVTIEDAHFRRNNGADVPAIVRGTVVEYGGRQALFVAARDSIEAQELEEQVLSYAGQLRRTVRQKSEQITALTRIATAISAGCDLNKVFQIVIFEVGKLVDFDTLLVVMVDDAGDRYRVVSAAGESISELDHGAVMPYAGSLFETVAADRSLRVCKDLLVTDLGGEANLLANEGLRSCVCLPLVSNQRVVGGLCLASRSVDAYSSRDVAILTEIADQVVVASQCSRLSSIEKRRSAELAIINEVGREAISTLDLQGLLRSAAVSIQKNFEHFDVSIFLVDWQAGEAVLTAEAGEDSQSELEGYRQRIGVGLVGWSAEHGETALANDVSREPRRIIAFDGDKAMGSELCVPIMIGGLAEGVIDVQCPQTGAFDESSVGALETLADLISRAIENALLFQNARSLTEFNERIIAMMPSILIVLDKDLNVVLVNEEYCKLRSVEKTDVENRPVTDLFDRQIMAEADLVSTLEQVLDTGQQVSLSGVRHRYRERVEVLNIHMSYIGEGKEPRIVMIVEDVTETVEHAYRLSMLRQINAAIQGALQLDKILRLVLTCVTAGRGLGFNRAVLLMVNRQNGTLEGWTGIGPRHHGEAAEIYNRMAAENKTLKEIITEGERFKRREDLPLYDLASKMVFSLDDESELVVRTVRETRAFLVSDAANDVRVSDHFKELISANEFVCVPIVAKDEVIGAIVADNHYDARPLTEERVELLTIFANHAGLAIENGEAYADLEEKVRQLAEAYETLEQTHDRLLQSEKLAVMGQMAASVAHEIRNPLVSIGGFARGALEELPEDHPCHEDIEIIVREVDRLEKILKDTLDFARPQSLQKALGSPNAVIEDICSMVNAEARDRDIEVQKKLDPKIPEMMFDAEQLKQALLNIVRNAIDSVNWGGRVDIVTRHENQRVSIIITDTGGGIPDSMLREVFNPFFTTKPRGTGLGLAVTRKIIEDHGGHITVTSKLGVGSTFTAYLPARAGNIAEDAEEE